jgi:hypothetical protein
MRNRQVGPDESTEILRGLVQRLTYKPKWRFDLAELDREQGSQGLTLCISADGIPNSLDPSTTTSFLHLMPVFPAAFNERAWQRWLLEQILLVERHESLEFFKIDGESPYFPAHGPGDDPYTVMEIRTRDEAHAPALPFHSRQVSDAHFA